MEQQGETQRECGAEPQAGAGAGAGGAGGVDAAELVRAAGELARENPHAALAGAFAVGFLLGGGLTPRLLASIALFAGRRYLAEAAREALAGAVQQQIEEAAAR